MTTFVDCCFPMWVLLIYTSLFFGPFLHSQHPSWAPSFPHPPAVLPFLLSLEWNLHRTKSHCRNWRGEGRGRGRKGREKSPSWKKTRRGERRRKRRRSQHHMLEMGQKVVQFKARLKRKRKPQTQPVLALLGGDASGTFGSIKLRRSKRGGGRRDWAPPSPPSALPSTSPTNARRVVLWQCVNVCGWQFSVSFVHFCSKFEH